MLFPDLPIMGVTATATTKVILDVQNMLNIPDCLVLRAPFNRPNLYYHVMEKPANREESLDQLEELLKNRYKNQSGIIYAFSIKDCEDIASGLLNRGVSVRAYHAKLEETKRHERHSKWLNGSIQAVVATVAFGMGIDKPDVRFVIHHTLSKSIENYYQESGRAGRDGQYAECVLMFRFVDMFSITSMVFSDHCGLKNAYAMVNYAIDGLRCRRDILSGYFAEVWSEKDCEKKCDRCLNRKKYSPPAFDILTHLTDLLKIVERAENMNSSLTGLKLIDAWYHKGPVGFRLIDLPVPTIDRHYGEQVVMKLLLDGYLKEDFQFTPFSTNSYIKRGTVVGSSVKAITFKPARVLQFRPQVKIETEHVDSESVTTSSETSHTKKSSSHKKKKRRSMLTEMDTIVNDVKKKSRLNGSTVEGVADVTIINDDDDLEIVDSKSEIIELD